MACGTEWLVFDSMAEERVRGILAGIGRARVALVGDMCLDAYWRADMTRSELSRETPHFPLPIAEERYAPGAGGNAAANIAALRPLSFAVIGAAGQDWRGDVLLGELASRGIDVSGIIRHPLRVTNAYIKPCRRGISDLEYEDPRLDFENTAPQPADLDDAIAAAIERAALSVDVICVSDQFRHGCVTAPVRETLVRLAAGGMKVVVDSRHRIGSFKGCILKPNELEGSAAVGLNAANDGPGVSGYAAAARELSRRSGSPVCMTLGGLGCLVAEGGELCHVPGVSLSPPLDICGAGDTFLAAFACSLAAGARMNEAAFVANLASSVTVKKLGQTGTASREEILGRLSERNAP